ncbi:MAG: DUF5119 domain-containing protein [Muribaculaceae bacterium]|nr:DUF5119 domain-containing protein [Muribaculaceae bacterium]
MRKSMWRYLLYSLAVLMCCSSCRQEICYDHYPAIDLSFTWEREWERDYGHDHKSNWDPAQHRYEYDALRPSVPEWVKMVRYYDDGRFMERFFTPDGAKFEVETNAKCSFLFYNGDTEYIILSDVASVRDVRATATSRSRSGSALQYMKGLHQTSRTTNPPDVIYSAYVEDVPGIVNHEVKHMPTKMQPLVFTYLVTFEFEHGIEHVALARGALGGMAEGVYLRTGVTTDEASIILFDCDIHSDGCRSQVRSFGIPGFPDSYFGRSASEQPGPFSLNLEVKLTNGKTMDYTFDITDQIQKQPRGGVIKVGGLRVEDDQAGKSPAGFDVDVSDWDDNIEVDLNMGLESK